MWPRADSHPRPEATHAAVIDVGSNSVRLVIYRVDGRALWTVYNEKVVAGLGRDLSAQGIVGDLGGTSLELVRLNGAGPLEGATLPLGPLALGAPKTLDPDRM